MRKIRTWLELGYKHKEIASAFRVSRSAISDININRTWRGDKYAV
jgi:predicted DNA-binding protein YlxM (UPF0122 family)